MDTGLVLHVEAFGFAEVVDIDLVELGVVGVNEGEGELEENSLGVDHEAVASYGARIHLQALPFDIGLQDGGKELKNCFSGMGLRRGGGKMSAIVWDRVFEGKKMLHTEDLIMLLKSA